MSFLKLINKGYLVSPDLDIEIDNEVMDKLDNLKEKPLVINNDFILALKDLPENINWKEFEKSRVDFEKKKNKEDYKTFLNILKYKSDKKLKSKIDSKLKSLSSEPKIKFENEEEFNDDVIVVKEYKENIKKKIGRAL